MAESWYFERGNQRFGPLSSQELRKLASTGGLRPTDLLWRRGMGSSVPASNAKGLFPEATSEQAPLSGTAHYPATQPPPVVRGTPQRHDAQTCAQVHDDLGEPQPPNVPLKATSFPSPRLPLRRILIFGVLSAVIGLIISVASGIKRGDNPTGTTRNDASGNVAVQQFERSVKTAILNWNASPRTSQGPATGKPNGIRGIPDGVSRALTLSLFMRNTIVMLAIGQMSGRQVDTEIVDAISAFTFSEHAVRDSLNRGDIEDFRGRAAMYYTLARLLQSEAPDEIADVFPNPADRQMILPHYRSIKAKVADIIEGHYRKTISLGLDKLLIEAE